LVIRKWIEKTYRWAQKNSLWVIHYNTGGCNGCDIEILDLLTPRYDVERLGIIAEASPRHADVLLCTGPVTKQTSDSLWEIYSQMPSPKWVVAVGSCSNTGGVFYGSDTLSWVVLTKFCQLIFIFLDAPVALKRLLKVYWN